MQTIAIYPGRFHPFHKGHASSFKQLADTFGINNTYLALSQKQELPKNPFSAGDRAKMAMALGIPKENIISVVNPYGKEEYAERFRKAGIDPDQTSMVFGVSKKDMEGVPELNIPPDPRFTFKPTKSGQPSYLQKYVKGPLEPMTKHAYVVSTDVAEFPIAGKPIRDASAIRASYAKGDEELRNRILTDLYGKAAGLIKPVFDTNLQLSESAKAIIHKLRPLLHEATTEQKIRILQLIKEATSLKTKKIDETEAKIHFSDPTERVNVYFINPKLAREGKRANIANSIPYKTVPALIDFMIKKYYPEFNKPKEKFSKNDMELYNRIHSYFEVATTNQPVKEAIDITADYLEEK